MGRESLTLRYGVLCNPVAAIGKRRAFGAAMIVLCSLAVIAWWGGLHLYPARGLRLTETRPSGILVIIESLLMWLSAGLLLFLVARVFGSRNGARMHLAAVGLSRFPLIFAALILSRQVIGQVMLRDASVGMIEGVFYPLGYVTPPSLGGGLLVAALIVWSVVLLYAGYREASKFGTAKGLATFVIALALAELLHSYLVTALIRAGV